MGIYNFEGAIQNSGWTWQSFGRELIETGDLDPIYVMLVEAPYLDDAALKRWLLAYFCYYHAGVASKIAEMGSNGFFDGMRMGIAERWPRGMERRYFWSKTAHSCITYLQSLNMTPEAIADDMMNHGTFQAVYDAVVAYNGFGPWMAWKIADMAERVLGVDVDFSNATLGIYKDPVQGAAMVYHGDWCEPIDEDELQEIVNEQIEEFKDLLAPPFYDRPINIQEVETNLCKFKAHYKGFYPMGNDTYHIRKALVGWGDLAQELLRWAPKVKPGHKGYDDG